MKVVQLSHYALPHVGGIELYVHRVARDLIAAGDSCEVISSAASAGAAGQGRIDGVPMTWLPSPRLLPRNPALLGLRRALERIRPDVVHVHSIWFLPSVQACLWKSGLRYRVVNSVHGVWPDQAGLAVGAFVRGFKPVAQRVLDASDRVLVYNQLERDKLHRHFRVAAERVREAPMGFDALAPAPALVEAARREHGRYLLFTGRIIADKNPAVLVQAFARLSAGHPDLRLLFAGPVEPGLRDQLLAGAPPGRAVFLGSLDPVADAARLSALYAAAELSVCIGSWEGMPTRILESLAQGTPVAAFAAGGVALVVRDGENGYLLRTLEPRELATAIDAHLRLSPEARAALSQRARASAQPYLWPASFARIRAALAETLTAAR